MHNVEHDCPSLYMRALDLDEVEVEGVEQQRQGLDHHQNPHQVVDLEHRVPVLIISLLRYDGYKYLWILNTGSLRMKVFN